MPGSQLKEKMFKCLGLVPILLFPGERRAFPIRISFWEADKVVRNSRASNMRYLVLRLGRVKPIIVCMTLRVQLCSFESTKRYEHLRE